MLGSSIFYVTTPEHSYHVEVIYQISNGCVENAVTLVVRDFDKNETSFSVNLEAEYANGDHISITEFKEAARLGLEKFKEEV